ncbi:hypothetical protein [Nonomuraea sp. CA-141351]|uniref:hypothetical protein n=1 Tax=Nonomuraea sp. CA-141351 TaxID=3239996 RepID=UPI003D93B064
MSAIPAITLICNHSACTTHAVLIGATDPAEARREAATRGWTSHHHQGRGHQHDHCPEHSKPPRPAKTKRTLRDRARNLARQALTLPPLPALGMSSRR